MIEFGLTLTSSSSRRWTVESEKQFVPLAAICAADKMCATKALETIIGKPLEERVALLDQELLRLRIDVEAFGCIAKALVNSPMAAPSARSQAKKIFVGDHRESIVRQLDGILGELGYPPST
jgi:hypothetical protein